MSIARTTEIRRTIPRDWQISNPNPPHCPSRPPTTAISPFPFFDAYRVFIRDILPTFDQQLSLDNLPSQAAVFMRDAFAQPHPTTVFHELMLRQFLQTCQAAFLGLVIQPKMVKASLLHNELFITSGLVKQRGLSVDMANYCDMLLAEVVDIYESIFANAISTKYWSKSKSVEEVISHLLTTELQIFRRLNDYSFKTLSASMIRRSLESAPPSAGPVIAKWCHENGIETE